MSKMVIAVFLVFFPLPALAKKHKSVVPCKTKFSVVTEDKLRNIRQGLPEKDAKWFKKKVEKHYPDVCYVAPAPDVPLVFFITVVPAVYHGARVVPSQSQSNTNISGDVDATATTTTNSSTTVPYSVNYGIYTLTVETRGGHGKKWVARHRFQQRGLYHTLYGIPLGGKGHHPVHAVIREAAKWIHDGGLKNPLEFVAPQ